VINQQFHIHISQYVYYTGGHHNVECNTKVHDVLHDVNDTTDTLRTLETVISEF